MLRFVFGEAESSVRADAAGVRVGVACPVVSGVPEERFDFGAGVPENDGGFAGLRTPDTLVMATAAPVDADSVERVTRRLYDELFRRTAGLHLYRIWHFVPDILGRPEGREETYRRFCVARAEAFDAAFAGDAERRMSAASATGTDGGRLVVVAVAGTALPEYFENPEQTPAYRYPATYGPRPPSFARASRVKLTSGTWVFVSGTAAVRGSDSCHAGDFAAQAALTEENLGRMVRLAAPAETPAATVSRLYLKHGVTPPDGFLKASGETLTVRSDVCRAELLLEAELTLRF